MATWTDGTYCGTYYMKSSYYCGRNVDRTVKACNTPRTCWHWPTDGSLVRCTDNDKVYKFIDKEKKLYLLDDQGFTNYYNNFWNGNITNKNGKSDTNCKDINWGVQNSEINRKPFDSVTTASEGKTVKCFEHNSSTFYRWTNGELKTYPNGTVAKSWDSNWANASTYKCDYLTSTGNMSNKIPDGTILKCSDDTSKYYRYNSSTNQVIYYPKINNEILKQYNNYKGYQWDYPEPQIQDCSQYKAERPNIKDSLQPLNTSIPDGTPMICLSQDSSNVYRYTSINDSITHYPNPETANTWDSTAWTNYKLYDCSRIWKSNSGANYNLTPCKPSHGTVVKCSDDNKYYSYASGSNTLLLYETPAIARQYSNFQLIQKDPITISIGRIDFTSIPSYITQLNYAAYTFSFDCLIESSSSLRRNIMSYTPTHRPAVYITSENKIQIIHATTKDPNANVVSNFRFTPGKWFTVTFIVNKRTMFTYFDQIKDNSYTTNNGYFNWGRVPLSDWAWNSEGAAGQGSVQVKNARFWPFAMALEWPNKFSPVEMIDEIDPYTNVKTGQQIAVTTLPPALNCKAFNKPGITFIPTQTISHATIKNGDSLKCKGIDDKIYRYNYEKDKIFEYAVDNKNSADKVAKSWDPNYMNYKAYNCYDYPKNAEKMEMKPADNAVVKCADDYKSYRYVNASNKLEWYMNDTIIKQYNPDWLITDRLTKNCNQYKDTRTVFEPTQNLSKSTRSLHDGTPLKCNNDTSHLYHYNSRYDVLMEYTNNIIATSWDPKAVDNFYSYKCDATYIANKGYMQERPKESTIIKCSNDEEKDNNFYYIYNYKDNILKPKPSTDSIKTIFPTWNSNNIKNNDCRQYFLLQPRFYDDSGGRGNSTKLTPEDYSGCVPLPYVPSFTQNRSLVRDGEQILLYTDSSCNNIYSNIKGDKDKDVAVNITYTPTNAYGDTLTESNPAYYKVVTDDIYNTQYNLSPAAPLVQPPPLQISSSGQVITATKTSNIASTPVSSTSTASKLLISEKDYNRLYGINSVEKTKF